MSCGASAPEVLLHCSSRRALSALILLLAGYVLFPVTPAARAESSAIPGGPVSVSDGFSLPPNFDAELDAAARDASLPEWQRDIMGRLARGERPDAGGHWSPGPEAAGPRVGTSNGGASTQVAPGEETWVPVSGTPKGLQGATAIYDPANARLIVFGGFYVFRPVNEVWALRLFGTPQWTPLATTGVAPAARYEHTAIYDAPRQRMIIFGGYSTSYRSDTWSLSLDGTPTWTELLPAGAVPAARSDHSAIYDAGNQRMVVFGGTNGARRSDVWTLSLSEPPAWSALAPAAGPTTRQGHTAIYDPVGARMIVFGGNDGGPRADCWALSLGAVPAWSSLTAAPSTAARSEHAAVYDSVNLRMVVSGGIGIGGTYLADTYALSLSGPLTWSLVPAGTTPITSRAYHTAIFDPAGQQVVVISGIRTSSTYLDDAWSLTQTPTSHWTQLAPPVADPGGVVQHTGIYDPVGQRMIVFGEFFDYGGAVWSLDLAGPPIWTRLNPAGTMPTNRQGHAAIYDPVGQRMIVCGRDANSAMRVWALSLDATPTWSEIITSGTPPSGRVDHTAIYDPAGHRLIIFAGYAMVGGVQHDTWALSLDGTPTWIELLPDGWPPNNRTASSAIYDPLNARMIIYSGYVPGFTLHDTWALSLTGPLAWTQLSTTGGPMEAFINHSAIYDPSGPRMIVSQGDSTWALPLDGTYAWQHMAPLGAMPKYRTEQAVIYDPVNARMVINAGYAYQPSTPTAELDDTWFLSLPPATSGVPIEPIANTLLALRTAPNPFMTSTTARFTLTRPQRVEARVFDVSGRRVRTLLQADLAAGEHEVIWDGRDALGRPAGNGVYFVRVVGGGSEAVTRVVRAR